MWRRLPEFVYTHGTVSKSSSEASHHLKMSTIFWIALATLAGHGRAYAQGPLPIEALRELAAERAGVVGALRVSYEVYQDPDPAQVSVQLPHIIRHVLIDADRGRYSVDRTVAVSDAAGEPRTEVTTHFDFDGVAQGAYLPERGIGLLKEDADLDPRVESGLWGVMLWSPPAPDGLGIDDGSLVSLLAHGRVRPHLETVGGRPCHVVDAFQQGVRYATVWLDVDRGLLPMRRVTYGHDGQPTSEVTVESVVYLEDQDLWLPESWQTVLHLAGRQLSKRTVIHPESVEINPPVQDDDFAPRFPPGTIVTDQIAGLTYRVGPEGEPGEVLYEQTEDGQWHRVGSAAPAGTPPRHGPGPHPSNGTSADNPGSPLAGIDELLAPARRAVVSAHKPSDQPATSPGITKQPGHPRPTGQRVSVDTPMRKLPSAVRRSGDNVQPAGQTAARPTWLDSLLRSPYLWSGLVVLVLAAAIGRARDGPS